MENPVKLGSVVKCIAGRDMDRYFVVVRCVDDHYVLISDGKTRKVQKPKLKKLRHITFEHSPDSVILQKILENTITNNSLRKYLFEYNYPEKQKLINVSAEVN